MATGSQEELVKITQAELSNHKKESDCWLAIHGKVYNVTSFKKHPGGFEILEDNAGKDATKPFDDIDHSESAKQDLAKYYIGEYIKDELIPPSDSKFNYLILVPIFIILLAIALSSLYA